MFYGYATASADRQASPSSRRIAGKQAGCCSLGDVWADNTTPRGHLMLTVLSGLAEFERELIHARTGDGRARAKARGVKLGRKPKLTPHQETRGRLSAGSAVTRPLPRSAAATT